jgi:hypothetical protein
MEDNGLEMCKFVSLMKAITNCAPDPCRNRLKGGAYLISAALPLRIKILFLVVADGQLYAGRTIPKRTLIHSSHLANDVGYSPVIWIRTSVMIISMEIDANLIPICNTEAIINI